MCINIWLAGSKLRKGRKNILTGHIFQSVCEAATRKRKGVGSKEMVFWKEGREQTHERRPIKD